MPENVSVKDVVVAMDLYPRDDFEQETVNKYRKALDRLPPITITQENILVDGYHRLIAHKIEQAETIPAEVVDIPREDVLWEATRRNASHGLQLGQKDKKRLGKQFYEDGKDVPEIAAALSVDDSAVYRWTERMREKEDEARDRKITEMYLACHIQDDIAEAVECSQPTVSHVIDDIKNSQLQENDKPDSLQLYNVWRFGGNDDRYGMDYPGRIPGQILENVLYYYTEPFDTVVDPFAGGGTTIDVCKEMNRRYRAYDINPVHGGIGQHDVTEGFPSECRGCDLIFLDPPYAQQKQGEYSGDATNLANLPTAEFYDAMEDVFIHCADTVAEGGYVVFIIGPSQNDGRLQDHAFELLKRAEQHLSYVYRVSVPYTTQQHGGAYVKNAKENRSMLYLDRNLVVLKNG